ncbi:hypothetical protein ACFOZ7_10600 [Natribaculum luteum]|uniref:Uncharacterized protein n=1 Tax=Natribaculum luteum TaxID=1586232 RepID=A0ABD5P081_9EURY
MTQRFDSSDDLARNVSCSDVFEDRYVDGSLDPRDTRPPCSDFGRSTNRPTESNPRRADSHSLQHTY